MHHAVQRLPLFIVLATALPAVAQTLEVDLGSVEVTRSRDRSSMAAQAVEARQANALKPATSDTASLLRSVPGVSLYGAGGVSSLPSIHGLADDRIRIKVDGMDLIASCPNHMNPALSYLDPSNVGALTVFAGIAPVSVGGDSIAGTIVADAPAPRFADAGQGSVVAGEVGAFYRSNGNAFGGNLAAAYATESFSLAYAGATSERDNIRAGRDFKASAVTGRPGHTLPLDEIGSTAYRSRNHEVVMAFKGGDQSVEARFGYQQMPYQLWPNQRMDLLDNVQQRLNLRYVGRFGGGTLEARAYREHVEHFMDFGPDKRFWYGQQSGGAAAPDGVPCSPIGPACAAGMPMNTESTNTGAVVKWSAGITDNDLLRLGAEYQRYRLDDWWPASGGGMWPNTFWNINDGKRDRAAVHAEWEGRPDPRWTTLAGVRYERVSSNTGPVQAYNNAVAPASTLVPAFNGRNRARMDDNWDATLIGRYAPDDTLAIEAGVARKVRSPSLYERYTWMSRGMEMLMVNWFGDGNGYVGNLALEPEKAHTVSATIDWHSTDRASELRVTPYYTRVTDYIDALRCPPSLGGACATQAPGDGKFVFLQFANQPARIYGIDVSGKVPLASTRIGDFGLQGLAGYTNGRNRRTGDSLYNIMPLNAKLALTHRDEGWDNAMEIVMVAAKDDASADRNEVATAGYALVNLRASYSWPKVRLDLGVENLFDRFYAEPLGGVYLGQGTTMTSSPVGSVPSWGTAVPGMGRSIYVGAKVTL
jgi:iron complex outermembrane receptor protein